MRSILLLIVLVVNPYVLPHMHSPERNSGLVQEQREAPVILPAIYFGQLTLRPRGTRFACNDNRSRQALK